MSDNLAQIAISCALSGNWKEAIKQNKEILKTTDSDVDALNRLARAYVEVGQINKAKHTTKTVLKIDPFNKIALRCIEKWKGINSKKPVSMFSVAPSVFLEEPGKTKIVETLHPGSENVLALINTGDELKFATHAHRVNIISLSGDYVGRLPDDLASKLKSNISKGYCYKVIAKSVDIKGVKIIIRETKRPDNLTDVPSFHGERLEYNSYTPKELMRNREVSTATLADDN